VALEDIDADNGPLIYYPGSHRLPEYSMQDLGLGTGYEYYKDYEQKVQGLINKHALQPEYGTIKKVEALIRHANLLQGGAPQKDMSRSRHSQVTHYYFADCEYYTPMNSDGKSVRYRRPEWVADVPLDEYVPVRPSLLERIKPRLIR